MDDLVFEPHGDLLFDNDFDYSLLTTDATAEPTPAGVILSTNELETWLAEGVVETWLEASKSASSTSAMSAFPLCGMQYGLCFIHSSVVDNVHPSVIRAILSATRQLPTTIQPTQHPTCFPQGYVVGFSPLSTLLHVIVERLDSRYAQQHLKNVLQLYHMGLTGDSDSRGQVLSQFQAYKTDLLRIQETISKHKQSIHTLQNQKLYIQTLEARRRAKDTFHHLVLGKDLTPTPDFQKLFDEKEHAIRRVLRFLEDKERSLMRALSSLFPNQVKVFGVPVSPIGWSVWQDLSRDEKFLPQPGVIAFGDNGGSLFDESRNVFWAYSWTRRQLAFNQQQQMVYGRREDPQSEGRHTGNVRLDLSADRVPDASSIHMSPSLLRARYFRWITRSTTQFSPTQNADFIPRSAENQDGVDIDIFMTNEEPDEFYNMSALGPLIHLPRFIAWEPGNFIVHEGPALPLSSYTQPQRIAVVWPQLGHVQRQQLLSDLSRTLAAIWDNFDILNEYVSKKERDESDAAGSNHAHTMPSKESDSYSARTYSDCNLLAQMEERFMNQRFQQSSSESPLISRNKNSADFVCNTANQVMDKHQQQHDEENEGGYYGLEQWTTTTSAAALKANIDQIQDMSVEIRGGVDSERMRQFDFSIDDILVAATGQQGLSMSLDHRLQIVGVSRWKNFDPTSSNPSALLPESMNSMQVKARLSCFPLVHLFTLPDALYDATAAGWNDLAKKVAGHSANAAHFMLLPLPDKERTLYRRWMAAWHTRSFGAPSQTLARFELLKKSRELSRSNVNNRDHQRRGNMKEQKSLDQVAKDQDWPGLDEAIKLQDNEECEDDISVFLEQIQSHILKIRRRRQDNDGVRKEKMLRQERDARVVDGQQGFGWSFGLPTALWTEDPSSLRDNLGDAAGTGGNGPSIEASGLQSLPSAQLAELENAIRACQLSAQEQALVDQQFSLARSAGLPSSALPLTSSARAAQLLMQML
ncbi:hypothetical protein BG004_007634 [Podila humilis]|nr:hypothetical protein BG004_007634 [Podila humilis]